MTQFKMVSTDRNIRQRNALQAPAAKTCSNENKSGNISAELQAGTSATKHRLWTRTVVILSVMTLVYFYSKSQTREIKFALVRENLPLRMQKFRCSPSYEKEMQQFPQCVPQKCGRFVADKLVEIIEADTLLDLAKKILLQAGSSGGASILDLHSGALSFNENFINVYNTPKLSALIREEHLIAYKLVKSKIKLAISEQFGISSESLFLTHPTFFSKITNKTAKTVHDEYWHEHVDKETYPSFHFTSLLYLNNFNTDFKGGRFIFVDGMAENKTTSAIEPRKARVSAFTSGEENRHYVEKVFEGERYAITISFTCDQNQAIKDPIIKT